MTDFFFGLWLFSRFLSLVFTNLNSVCVGVLLSNSWTSGLMCFIVSDHYLFNYFFYTVLSPFSSKISTTNILNCLILSYNLVLFIFFPFCVSLWIRFTNFLSNCVVYWWPWKKTVHLWYYFYHLGTILYSFCLLKTPHLFHVCCLPSSLNLVLSWVCLGSWVSISSYLWVLMFIIWPQQCLVCLSLFTWRFIPRVDPKLEFSPFNICIWNLKCKTSFLLSPGTICL